jgi:hypothetical protein
VVLSGYEVRPKKVLGAGLFVKSMELTYDLFLAAPVPPLAS